MKTIYRVIFTMGFKSKNDRDIFQAYLNEAIPTLISSLKTRVTEGPDLTQSNEIGYEWFDKESRDAVWASRYILGFSSVADRDACFTMLMNQFGEKDVSIDYYRDNAGKVGAVNKDVVVIKESSDFAQTSIV